MNHVRICAGSPHSAPVDFNIKTRSWDCKIFVLFLDQKIWTLYEILPNPVNTRFSGCLLTVPYCWYYSRRALHVFRLVYGIGPCNQLSSAGPVMLLKFCDITAETGSLGVMSADLHNKAGISSCIILLTKKQCRIGELWATNINPPPIQRNNDAMA